jgi:Glucose / Sorbosone dehydrogenase
MLTLVLLAAVAAACSSQEPAGPATGPTSSGGEVPTSPTGPIGGATSSPPGLADVRIRLVPVVELEQPIAMAVRSGDRAMYVAEKTGLVVALTPGSDPRVVLDLTDRVSLGSEQGLLGLAFSPDGRFLYVDFTDVNGDTNVTEFAFGDDGADPASERRVLFVDQPFSNHNGGELVFGPDGYLYVGLGDGGSAGDPMGNAQSLSTLLGKLLRISPRPFKGEPYAIPPDNPFVGRDGARPEIWAFGLRNPWRFSFDSATGDLWIGTSGRTPGRRSTWSRQVRTGGRTSDGTGSRGPTRSRGARPRTRSRRSSSTGTATVRARSPAGTCTAASGSPSSPALTCSGTTAEGSWRRSSRVTAGRRRCGRSARGSMPWRRSARMRGASSMCCPWRGRSSGSRPDPRGHTRRGRAVLGANDRRVR